MENPTFQTCRTSETSKKEFRRNDRHPNAKATHSTMYSTMAKLRVCGKKSLNLTHSALEEREEKNLHCQTHKIKTHVF